MKTLFVRQRLKDIRKEKSLSLAQVASALAMTERNYQRLESGEAKRIDLEVLIQFAEFVDVPLFDLFADEDTVRSRMAANSVAIQEIGITKAGSSTELTDAALELRSNYQALLAEQASIIRQQAQLIETLIHEKKRGH